MPGRYFPSLTEVSLIGETMVSAFNDGAGPEFNGISVAYQYAWGGR
jgi:hypothetical protein